MTKKLSIRKKYKNELNNLGYHIDHMKPYNIILDIDETLIHSKVNINNENISIILRPNLRLFLDYCYQHFNVGYWTLGTKKYCLDLSYKYVWGMKKSGERIRNNKENRSKKNIIFIEDGFTTSYGTKNKNTSQYLSYELVG